MTLIVDLVMAFVVLEAIVFLVRGHKALFPNLAAGLLLLVAMRLALGGAALPWVGVALLAAGLAHLTDLRRHFQKPRPGETRG